MLKELELIEGDTIAIDSFKIFAQNNLKNNFNQKKIDRHIEYIDKKVEEYETQLNESDAEDRQELLKKKIAEKLFHRKHYEQLSEKLAESSEKQISLIDSKDFSRYRLKRINSFHCFSIGIRSHPIYLKKAA